MIARLGVLTSGGDCAGLNAAIRAVVLHAAEAHGAEVWGIRNGTEGLMRRPVAAGRLRPEAFDGTYLRRGGTVLGSISAGDPFAWPMPDGTVRDRTADIAEAVHGLRLDGLVAIGGDGSFAIMDRLARTAGLKVVGIPKTIDNDVRGTDVSIGFHTAVEVATEALDRLQPTAASHDRIMILEVMGRDAGHIAINAGIAGGADVILVPEIRYTLDGIRRKFDAVRASGRDFGLMVVAEAVPTPEGDVVKALAGRYGGIGIHLAERVRRDLGIDARVTVLGHVQRGGEPVFRDRVLASALGVHAVDMAAAGRWGRMACWRGRGVADVPFAEVVGGTQPLSPDGILACTARSLGIYIGET